MRKPGKGYFPKARSRSGDVSTCFELAIAVPVGIR